MRTNPWVCFGAYKSLGLFQCAQIPGFVSVRINPWVCFGAYKYQGLFRCAQIPGFVSVRTNPWVCFGAYKSQGLFRCAQILMCNQSNESCCRVHTCYSFTFFPTNRKPFHCSPPKCFSNARWILLLDGELSVFYSLAFYKP